VVPLFDYTSGLYMNGDATRDRLMGASQFIQADNMHIVPGDLANANLYFYVGGNPVSGRDPTGHFDLLELLVDTALSVSIGAISAPVLASAATFVAAGLISAEAMTLLKKSGADAFTIEGGGSAFGSLFGIPLAVSAGIEGAWSPQTHRIAAYLFGQIGLTFGAGDGGSLDAGLGIYWGAPTSQDYAGGADYVYVPFSSLPISYQLTLKGALTHLISVAPSNIASSLGVPDDVSDLIDSFGTTAIQLLNQLNNLSVTYYNWGEGQGLLLNYSDSWGKDSASIGYALSKQIYPSGDQSVPFEQ
jgi:hypothetical protein